MKTDFGVDEKPLGVGMLRGQKAPFPSIHGNGAIKKEGRIAVVL